MRSLNYLPEKVGNAKQNNHLGCLIEKTNIYPAREIVLQIKAQRCVLQVLVFISIMVSEFCSVSANLAPTSTPAPKEAESLPTSFAR